MRRLLLTVASLIAASPVAAIDDRQSCLNQKAGDVRIEACSRVIGTTPQDATAYYNRGATYQQKGDFDRAIADFSKAIELKANYGAAYNARGFLHAAKGDYQRALADVMRADEIAKERAKAAHAIVAQEATRAHKKESQQPKPKVLAKASFKSPSASTDQLPKWAPPFNDSP
jgi:tetratricopeptide (TPR) repeat protein